jgi:branched-chain amino acid transport system ATP-binding protein
MSRLLLAQALAAGLALAGLAGAIAAALLLNDYYIFVLGQIALLALVGIGLNLLIGLNGQISFGHAGFYAIGAYAVAIATSRFGVSFWIAWPVGAAVAAGLGVLLAIPALRVKGPYLAMVTIAFGLIVEQALIEFEPLTGGQNGILDIPSIHIFGIDLGDRGAVVIALMAAAAAFLAARRIAAGAWGAALRAVRDSDVAAASIGIDPVRVRIAAFALSAFCAGLAGGLFAPMAAFVTPQSFGFSLSIMVVLVVVIGGAGTMAGPLLGALIVGLLPELLSAFEAYRTLAYGLLVLVVLWAAPDGVAGAFARLVGVRPKARPVPVETALASARPRAGLTAKGVAIGFGGVRAVDGLDIAIVPGRVTALIGPNGAGKSTALNMLSGYYRPQAGAITIGDAPLPLGRACGFARAGIARSYQSSALFGSLSVEANVQLAMRKGRPGGLFGRALADRSDERAAARALLIACGFVGDPAAPAEDLAHVDRRLVEIARALATDPDILLLDEPAAGLSQAEKRELADLLRAIAAAGIGIGLVEHDMRLVMGTADDIVVLAAGIPIAHGAPAQVQADEAVRTAYLGSGPARAPRDPAADARPRADLLRLGAVGAGYGAAPVLDDIWIDIQAGETVALLGANGAGKSTLMRVLSGLLAPSSGDLLFEGQRANGWGAAARVRHGIALSPEGRQVFPELSVRDNIRLGGFTRRAGAADRLEAMFDRFPVLRRLMHRRAGLLSGGEQQMLAIARALMAEPRLLLLDEPSLGLSPKATEDLFDQLDRLRAEGVAMLIVDQMADVALAIADRAYVLSGGRIVAQGPAAAVAADPALAESYLGGG